METLSQNVQAILDLPPIDREDAINHSWNPDDTSDSIHIVEGDLLTLERQNMVQSTDCARGKQGYTKGMVVFSVRWSSLLRGTHAGIGLATSQAQLHEFGYHLLAGRDDQSWGWDLQSLKVIIHY